MNFLNTQKCPISFVKKKSAASRGSSSHASGSSSSSATSSSSSTTGSYCSNHGGSQARHYEKDCRLNKGGFSSASKRVVDKSNVPKKTSGNTFCKWWCGKTWFHGHWCPEYQAMKGSFKVLSVKREADRHQPYSGKRSNNNRRPNKGKGKQRDSESNESDLSRKAMEDKECKSSTSNKNTFNLIAPLLLNDIRIIGKVDPGSDVSIINKSVLNKKFYTVKNIRALGGYLTFLSMNKDGSAAKYESVGSTDESSKVTYTV